jgi:hypothetical protein
MWDDMMYPREYGIIYSIQDVGEFLTRIGLGKERGGKGGTSESIE